MIRNTIIAFSLLLLIVSCKKDPKKVVKEDFFGAYTFDYTYTSKKITTSGGETYGIDTVYSGSRTIIVENSYDCDSITAITIRNPFGKGSEFCAVTSGNTYILDQYEYIGDGKLEGDKLSISIASNYDADYNIKGTATKN